MKTRTRIASALIAAGLAFGTVACSDDDVDLSDQTGQLDPDVDPDLDVDVDADVDPDADADATAPDTDGSVATGGEIAVGDQTTDGIFVTVALARIDGGPGFVTIRADVDGAPGPLLGYAAIPEGDNVDVQVKLDQPIRGEIDLWAVIHIDSDLDRVLDFPDGNDVPLEEDGERIQEPFTASLD